MRPNPLSLSNPGVPMSIAVLSKLVYSLAGTALGLDCKSKAATAAACGAAAEVPKKFGNPVPSVSEPKNVVSTPSGATISGFWERGSGVASRLPDTSNKIGVAPDEEKDSKIGGETLNAGVLEYRAAPTASAPT